MLSLVTLLYICGCDLAISIFPFIFPCLGDDDLELLSLPPALKEKYIRLQTENKMLKTKMGEAGDNSTMQSMLEDSQSRVQELETESR